MPTDLPNLLTLARIAAVPVVVALALTGSAWAEVASGCVFAVAAATDYFDGYFARRFGRTSDFGRMMDPIADKLLVAATLMVLAASGRLAPYGLAAALIVLLREILVSGLREYLASRRIALPVTPLAKWKTSAQMAALGLLLVGDAGGAILGHPDLPIRMAGLVLLWTACVLTLITGAAYFRVALGHTARGVREPAIAPPP